MSAVMSGHTLLAWASLRPKHAWLVLQAPTLQLLGQHKSLIVVAVTLVNIKLVVVCRLAVSALLGRIPLEWEQ